MEAFWVVTLIFGVLASLIAHGKGRNSLGWFLAGTFIGPFALVVAFLPPVVRDGMYSACPECREVIHQDAAACRFCRSALDRR
jgi:hypothetical protein